MIHVYGATQKSAETHPTTTLDAAEKFDRQSLKTFNTFKLIIGFIFEVN